MSYGPKNDDGDFPGEAAAPDPDAIADEVTEDMAPEPDAHLHAEHAKPTSAQIEASLKVEADNARRHKQIVLLVNAVDAFQEIEDLGRDGFTMEEWTDLLVLHAKSRLMYGKFFERDLIARRV